ncbi:MAG: hypothetical protein ACE5E7_18290 [Anaerolineae bacterium]
MNETTTDANKTRQLPPLWTGLAAVLLLVVVATLLGPKLLSGNTERPLKPLRPSPTPAQLGIDGQPTAVTFAQLDADPFSYQGKRIRVTGDYSPVAAEECLAAKGPVVRWSLLAEGLRLDAVGLEGVLTLVPPGTHLTVEGTWLHYTGPSGCGKEPPRGNIWYLAADRIVQPNPLPNFGQTPMPPTSEGQPPTSLPAATGTTASPPSANDTPGAVGPATGAPTPTMTPRSGTTSTPRRGTATATAVSSGTDTLTPTTTRRATATPTGTPPPGSTATPTRPPAPTSTGGAPTQPPLATSTPGGYPGPPTPGTTTPTATPEPYD